LASSEAEVGAELQKYTEEALNAKLYNTDRIKCINDLCHVLVARGKKPVFFFDDTDHFLRQGSIDRTSLIDPFFVDIVPMFTEFGCAIILNAHNSYNSYETFKDAKRNIFHDVISIPVFEYEEFTSMLTKRVRAANVRKTARDVFDEEALELVYDYPYRKKSEERMRKTLLPIQDALFETVKEGNEIITVRIMARALLAGGY